MCILTQTESEDKLITSKRTRGRHSKRWLKCWTFSTKKLKDHTFTIKMKKQEDKSPVLYLVHLCKQLHMYTVYTLIQKAREVQLITSTRTRERHSK